MAPVVTAASLAAGRSALGLGAAATEGVGQGLADDGIGNLTLFFNPIGDTTPQSVTSAFGYTKRILFANVTYTFPLSSTLRSGFGFWIDTDSFIATLVINAADAFNGMSTGASLAVGPGQSVFVYTNAAGVWNIDKGVLPGLNSAQNLQLNATVAASALTIALKDRNGNDPSFTSPIILTFSLFGNNVSRAVATPLSVTVPSGASLGTASGLTNRIWIGLFDNAGTPVLGVYNSLFFALPITIVSWDETAPTTTTAISAGSTATQTWYTQGGALTAKPLRILGYIESTQPTAGAWTVAPTKIQLFGPGIKKPGDVVQTTLGTRVVQTASASGAFVTSNITAFIALSSAADVVYGTYYADCQPTGGASQTLVHQATRGSTQIGQPFNASAPASTTRVNCAATFMDLPNTVASTAYAPFFKVNAAQTGTFPDSSGQILLQEIFI